MDTSPLAALQRTCTCILSREENLADRHVEPFGADLSVPLWKPEPSQHAPVDVFKLEGQVLTKGDLLPGADRSSASTESDAATCQSSAHLAASDASPVQIPQPPHEDLEITSDFSDGLTAPLLPNTDEGVMTKNPQQNAKECELSYFALDFPLEDLVFKPWSSWDRSKSDQERLERCTHFVLYYMIWWILLPMPWLVYPNLRPVPMLSIFLTLLASNNHWRNVQYGGWRHCADGLAVTALFAISVHCLVLGRAASQATELFLSVLPLGISSLLCFGMAWLRSVQGCVQEGMLWHLAFRSTGFWLFTYCFAIDSSLSLAAWWTIISLHTLLYWLSARWIWMQANRALGR